MPAHPIGIPKDNLYDLYIKKKLSTGAIAKLFRCNHVTILNYLNKYEIPRRSRLGNRKPIKVSKEDLIKLYHDKKLTQEEIAESLGHSCYGIYRWMKIYGVKTRSISETHTRYPKSDFNGELLEKVYLIGFRLGDLNIYKIRDLVQARCSTTIREQLKLIRNLFRQYGNVHVWKAKRGTFEIIVLLNKTFDFLLPKNDTIEDWILDNNEYFLAFLAGYADAEGSYYIRKPYYKFAKSGWGVFEIQSYDKGIISNISKKLNDLGIENAFCKSRIEGYIDKRGVKSNKNSWRITINKKQSLWNFIKLVEPYHKHEGKLRDLRRVKDNLIVRNALPYCRSIVL